MLCIKAPLSAYEQDQRLAIHAPQPWRIFGKNFNYYSKFEVIMYDFTPHRANQPASDKQLCYAYDLAERQGLDAEALCSINFHKEYSDMTANEASQLIELLTQ